MSESRLCGGCNYIHPPPWDKLCPIKLKKEGNNIEVSKFITDLTSYLLSIKNASDMINLLRKTIEDAEKGR